MSGDEYAILLLSNKKSRKGSLEDKEVASIVSIRFQSGVCKDRACTLHMACY